jgi:hypothetical protein
MFPALSASVFTSGTPRVVKPFISDLSFIISSPFLPSLIVSHLLSYFRFFILFLAGSWCLGNVLRPPGEPPPSPLCLF